VLQPRLLFISIWLPKDSNNVLGAAALGEGAWVVGATADDATSGVSASAIGLVVGCSGVAIVLSVGNDADVGAVLTGSKSDFNGSTGVGAAMMYIVCYVCLWMTMR
jgi:hypothetical protein